MCADKSGPLVQVMGSSFGCRTSMSRSVLQFDIYFIEPKASAGETET